MQVKPQSDATAYLERRHTQQNKRDSTECKRPLRCGGKGAGGKAKQQHSSEDQSPGLFSRCISTSASQHSYCSYIWLLLSFKYDILQRKCLWPQHLFSSHSPSLFSLVVLDYCTKCTSFYPLVILQLHLSFHNPKDVLVYFSFLARTTMDTQIRVYTWTHTHGRITNSKRTGALSLWVMCAYTGVNNIPAWRVILPLYWLEK